MTELVDKKAFNRQFARLATPIAVQSLILALVAVCDAIMILACDFWIDFSCKTSPADNRDKLRRRGKELSRGDDEISAESLEEHRDGSHAQSAFHKAWDRFPDTCLYLRQHRTKTIYWILHVSCLHISSLAQKIT